MAKFLLWLYNNVFIINLPFLQVVGLQQVPSFLDLYSVEHAVHNWCPWNMIWIYKPVTFYHANKYYVAFCANIWGEPP